MDYLIPYMFDLPGDMFSPIAITLDNHESPLDDIDPDLHYYNELHFLNGVNCSYLNDDSLNKMYDSHTLKTRKLSLFIFHMNIRSISWNINAMSDYIVCLNVDFHVISISEIWLKEDNCGLYDIPGYHCKEKHRPNDIGKLHSSFQGVLLTEISDHLPVIHYKFNYHDPMDEKFIIRRNL